MSTILAIDPGPTQSSWLVWSEGKIVDHGIDSNSEVREFCAGWNGVDVVVIEWLQSYGMVVGAEVFDTCRWVGRFAEAAERGHPCRVEFLTRTRIKTHLCNTPAAKDPNVRRVLLDRFGGDHAKGTKAHPGPLYGVHDDIWAALAVAVVYAETAA
jgi:hypothetical protein